MQRHNAVVAFLLAIIIFVEGIKYGSGFEPDMNYSLVLWYGAILGLFMAGIWWPDKEGE